MDRLRGELRTQIESELKTRLKSVNNKINDSVLAAVTGTDRIEENFCPLASLLVSRHLWLMSKPDVSLEVVEEATSSITVLLDAMKERIGDLKIIWRRQRMDVDTQIRYYANGLLEDYYRKYRKAEFDTDLENFEEASEWDSEDEWTSEDGGDVHNADNTNTSTTAVSTTSRSIPAGGHSNAYREVRGQGGHRVATHNSDEDGEGEGVEGEADQEGEEGEEQEVQEREEEEEAQEQEEVQEQEEEEEMQEQEPERVEEEDGEEEGYTAQNDEEYEAGEPEEEDEDEDGGYSYQAAPVAAPRRWRR